MWIFFYFPTRYSWILGHYWIKHVQKILTFFYYMHSPFTKIYIYIICIYLRNLHYWVIVHNRCIWKVKYLLYLIYCFYLYTVGFSTFCYWYVDCLLNWKGHLNYYFIGSRFNSSRWIIIDISRCFKFKVNTS